GRETQRGEVIAKHTKNGVPPVVAEMSPAKPARKRDGSVEPPAVPAAEGLARKTTRALAKAFTRADKDSDDDDADLEPAFAAAPPAPYGSAKSFAPPKPPKVNVPQSLPLADAEPTAKAPAERRKGEYAMPPAALLDAAKAERKIDERELMDGARLLEEKCREFAVEGR